jgi:hypothetical protein
MQQSKEPIPLTVSFFKDVEGKHKMKLTPAGAERLKLIVDRNNSGYTESLSDILVLSDRIYDDSENAICQRRDVRWDDASFKYDFMLLKNKPQEIIEAWLSDHEATIELTPKEGNDRLLKKLRAMIHVEYWAVYSPHIISSEAIIINRRILKLKSIEDAMRNSVSTFAEDESDISDRHIDFIKQTITSIEEEALTLSMKMSFIKKITNNDAMNCHESVNVLYAKSRNVINEPINVIINEEEAQEKDNQAIDATQNP